MNAVPTLLDDFQNLRGDYDAAKSNNFTKRRTLPAGGAGPDWHYRSEADYLRIMEITRDIERNDYVVPQGVERLITNVLQTGIPVDPQTGDKEADTILWDAFEEWSTDKRQVSWNELHTWHDIEKLTLRRMIYDGSLFNLPMVTGQIQSIEAHRCRTPRTTKRNVIHGVLVGDRGQPVQYWFTKEELSPLAPLRTVRETTPIDAVDASGNPNVWHHYVATRADQHQGVSWLCPMVWLTGLLDDIQFAELVKQQVASCITILREQNGTSVPDGTLGDDPGTMGETETRTSSSGVNRLVQHLFPGMEVVGKRGEKLQMFTPNLPGDGFFKQSHLVLTFLAINLGLPLAILLLDPSQTNFSGWRGAVDQARMKFRDLQVTEVGTLHRPNWRQFVRRVSAEPSKRGARLRALATRNGVDLYRAGWNPQGYPYIEPLKDRTANHLSVATLQNSPRRIANAQGLDHETLIDEIIADHSYSILGALKAAEIINSKYPAAGIGWRDVLFLTHLKELSVVVGDGAAPSPKSQDEPGPPSPEPKGALT
ncbi:MAG TPA: hypothetical protein DCQ94_06780 [Nitrospira sp.]|nr:hypothetical protein [Nitrospira sp.]